MYIFKTNMLNTHKGSGKEAVPKDWNIEYEVADMTLPANAALSVT